MKKINKKQKLIVFIAIIMVLVITGVILGANVIKTNIANGNYNSANNNSSSGNLLPEYIKEGVTLGGVTGTLVDLDTSDATATAEDIMWGKTAYVKGEKITGTHRTLDMLNIGDYVDYSPDISGSYQLEAAYSGYSTNQTITQDVSLKWRIMSINNDGTVNLVSSFPTSQTIYLQGAKGYNNGVFILNDIAEKQYSNKSKGIIARSINIEDIERYMNETGKQAISSYSTDMVKHGEKNKTPYLGENNYYPSLYAQENGSGINSTNTKQDGISLSDKFYKELSGSLNSYSQANQGGLTVTQTYYYFVETSNYFNNNKFYETVIDIKNYYWVASRFSNAYSTHADFGIRIIGQGAIGGYYLYTSGNYDGNTDDGLRPVVTLNSNTKLYGGDGTEEHPYLISK